MLSGVYYDYQILDVLFFTASYMFKDNQGILSRNNVVYTKWHKDQFKKLFNAHLTFH